MQLRRVAELAGMVEYCDFATQVSNEASGSDSNGARVRPDMVVKLPSGRRVIVDAKTNIQAYLDALQAPTPEDAARHLDRFAQHVAQQATELSKKEYWKQFEGSPEFVVMFVPGDQFVDAALSRQPDILEQAAVRNVILASPATLIGLLRAVAIGYREERLAKEAHALRDLGREFLDRIANVVEPLAALAKNLEAATNNYNRFVSSYESRLLPTLNKFEESGVTSKKKLEALGSVSTHMKSLPGAASNASQQALPGPELFKE
jgi:DNA recombination protein RmuC